jgi:hypothetical protein
LHETLAGSATFDVSSEELALGTSPVQRAVAAAYDTAGLEIQVLTPGATITSLSGLSYDIPPFVESPEPNVFWLMAPALVALFGFRRDRNGWQRYQIVSALFKTGRTIHARWVGTASSLLLGLLGGYTVPATLQMSDFGTCVNTTLSVGLFSNGLQLSLSDATSLSESILHCELTKQ